MKKKLHEEEKELEAQERAAKATKQQKRLIREKRRNVDNRGPMKYVAGIRSKQQ